MIKRRKRLDPARFEPVEQAIVEIEALFIDRADPVGKDSRPGDGKPVGFGAKLRHQIEVRLKPVVVVAGDIARIPTLDPPRHVGKRIPDRGLASVHGRSAFDLIGSRRHPKDEVTGKTLSQILRRSIGCHCGSIIMLVVFSRRVARSQSPGSRSTKARMISVSSTGFFDAGKMRGAGDFLIHRPRNEPGKLAHQRRRGRAVLGAHHADCRQLQRGARLGEVAVTDRRTGAQISFKRGPLQHHPVAGEFGILGAAVGLW